MRVARKVLKYQLQDVARSRWVVAYALLFLLLTDALFRFGGSGDRVILSLMNVVLIFIPLVSLMFGILYLYNAREFTELLLSQPVGRGALFVGLFGGIAAPLALAFLIGVGLPFALHGGAGQAFGPLAILLGTGVLLTLVFTALAFLVAVRFEDRARGLGAGLVLWLFSAVIYDGLVLLAAVALADYPLEGTMLGLMALNPIDLGRVLLLLTFDFSALMGYTGAVFERFFGTHQGVAVALSALFIWIAGPLVLALRRFQRKDF
jgi:Cu-processing system permease protein